MSAKKKNKFAARDWDSFPNSQWKFTRNLDPKKHQDNWKSRRQPYYKEYVSPKFHLPQNPRPHNNSKFKHSRFPRNKDKKRKNNNRHKTPQRASSPLCGTEEYTLRKIQQTSDMIKKHLLSPAGASCSQSVQEPTPSESENVESAPTPEPNQKKNVTKKDKIQIRRLSKYDITEIHHKIINHISNLNYGKKINLINSESSGYATAIHQIHKQQRLELSQALRDMSQQVHPTASDIVNSIIPDFDIKLEELPRDIIQELSCTLNIDVPEFTKHTQIGCTSENNDFFVYVNEDEDSDCDDNSDHNQAEVKPPALDTGWGANSDKNNIVELVSSVDIAEDNLREITIKTEPYTRLEDYENIIDLVSPVDVAEDNLQQITIKTEPCTNLDDYQDNIVDLVSPVEVTGDNLQQVTIKTEPCTNQEDYSTMAPNNLNDNQCNLDSVNLYGCNNSVISEDLNINYRFDNVTVKTEPDSGLTDYCASSLDSAKKGNAEDPVNGAHVNSSCHDINEKSNYNFTNIHSFKDDTDVNLKEKFQIGEIPISVENPNELTMNTNSNINENHVSNSTSIPPTNTKESPKVQLECGVQTDRVEIFEDLTREVKDLQDAVDLMLEIDCQIAKLTKMRQSIFLNLSDRSKGVKRPASDNDFIAKKPRLEASNLGENLSVIERKSVIKLEPNDDISQYTLLEDLKEKILILKVKENYILAASETGSVFFFCVNTRILLHTLKVTTLPVTTINFYQVENKCHLVVGSLDVCLMFYNFATKDLVRRVQVNDTVQCMEISWNYVFLGCHNGFLKRYSIERNIMEYEDKISMDNILVIKAAQEGARKILLVCTKNAPVCIRDSVSFLHMRTLDTFISSTVYSLLLENNLVYCGTVSNNVLVYNFHDGKLVNKLDFCRNKCVSCMKIVGTILVAGCHDGNVYIYDIKKQHSVECIPGPGGVILSLDVLANKIFVSTMSSKFKTLVIPSSIFNCT